MILAESLFTDLDRPPVEGFGLARCGKPRGIAAIIRARLAVGLLLGLGLFERRKLSLGSDGV
jgi:hypothetical protein